MLLNLDKHFLSVVFCLCLAFLPDCCGEVVHYHNGTGLEDSRQDTDNAGLEHVQKRAADIGSTVFYPFTEADLQALMEHEDTQIFLAVFNSS